MSQGLVEVDALAWVQHEHLLHEVFELGDLAMLVFREALVANQFGQEVLAGGPRGDEGHFLLWTTFGSCHMHTQRVNISNHF